MSSDHCPYCREPVMFRHCDTAGCKNEDPIRASKRPKEDENVAWIDLGSGAKIKVTNFNFNDGDVSFTHPPGKGDQFIVTSHTSKPKTLAIRPNRQVTSDGVPWRGVNFNFTLEEEKSNSKAFNDTWEKSNSKAFNDTWEKYKRENPDHVRKLVKQWSDDIDKHIKKEVERTVLAEEKPDPKIFFHKDALSMPLKQFPGVSLDEPLKIGPPTTAKEQAAQVSSENRHSAYTKKYMSDQEVEALVAGRRAGKTTSQRNAALYEILKPNPRAAEIMVEGRYTIPPVPANHPRGFSRVTTEMTEATCAVLEALWGTAVNLVWSSDGSVTCTRDDSDPAAHWDLDD